MRLKPSRHWSCSSIWRLRTLLEKRLQSTWPLLQAELPSCPTKACGGRHVRLKPNVRPLPSIVRLVIRHTHTGWLTCWLFKARMPVHALVALFFLFRSVFLFAPAHHPQQPVCRLAGLLVDAYLHFVGKYASVKCVPVPAKASFEDTRHSMMHGCRLSCSPRRPNR